MRFLASSTCLCAALISAMAARGATEITQADAISATGVGAVKFGMTLAEAAAAGVTLTADADKADATCFYAHPAKPKGLRFMIRDGKIVRADMTAPATLKTAQGFKRGDKEGEITGYYSANGGVSDEPLSEDSDVTVLAAPEFSDGADTPRIVYELLDPKGVFAIHAGWLPRHFTACPK